MPVAHPVGHVLLVCDFAERPENDSCSWRWPVGEAQGGGRPSAASHTGGMRPCPGKNKGSLNEDFMDQIYILSFE